MNAFNHKGSHERLGVSSEGRLIGTASGKDYTKQIAEALLEEQKTNDTASEDKEYSVGKLVETKKTNIPLDIQKLSDALGLARKSAGTKTQDAIGEFPKSTWRMQKNQQTPTIQLKRTKNYLAVQIAEIEAELKERDDA